MNKNNRIYADHNATTPLCDGALEGMRRAMEVWGNPSSSHGVGRDAEGLLAQSRKTVADALGVRSDEVVFTSGGSEADNMALMGCFFSHRNDFRIVSSPLEHSAVKDTVCMIETLGGQARLVETDGCGQMKLDDFQRLLDDFKPQLVSIMAANNETGVLFPISKITQICRERGILMHTDAVNAFGKVDSSQFMDADLISVSAHKIYGPKGIGALIIKKGIQLTRLQCGGAQEIKHRGGTQNMIGIAGFAGACSQLSADEPKRIEGLRDRFETTLKKELGDEMTIQCVRVPRTPNTSNIRFHGIASDLLLTVLDLDGLCVSSGSACSSGSVKPSHVLTSLGLTEDEAKEAIRISWGRSTTEADIDRAATLVVEHVQRIRARRAS